MFTLLHQGEALGTSSLHQADPDSCSISGTFDNVGGPIALAGWVMAHHGVEDGDVVYLRLDSDFQILKGEAAISYDEATLIVVPDENEAYLDVSMQDKEAYQNFFMSHALAVG